MDVLPERTPSLVSPLAIDFERFVLSASPALLRTAFLLSGDRDHAEDLLQAALWRVYQHWSVIRESPNGYAHAVLINLSRDRRRALRRRPAEVEPTDRPDVAAVDEIGRLLERDTVTRAVRGLPRRQREVVVLRFFLDLSVAETAAALGTSEGAVKAYAARGLARMRALFEGDLSCQETVKSEVRDVH